MAESSPEAPLELGLPVLSERRYSETLVRVHVSPEGQGTAKGGPTPDRGPAG